MDTQPIPEEDDPEFDRPSKSQKKRDMDALQDMGVELAALSPERLNRIEMPDALRAALRDAQRITQNGAKKRQRQYIGKLMRDVDVGPIKAALDEVKGISAAAKAEQHRLERLRAQLMESEEVLGDIARQHPGADLQHLRQLRRNALKEQQLGKPPRAYRELFRLLRELQSQATEDTEFTEENP
ncbi:Putative alpha helix protein [Georgfuchsia toluolica]|uniref:Dual-action ribosomal maturation protein DarP n=1 Tax=Georgfuchsia toluolica TaxID=424218 RepID=A0A916J844_9PROT|nr:ribosome biogenesis factor YjgA [Georgfuchsia toluolica]CAG4885225.1 Putative alpha helix protein [Georgfuchsia toluolica]